MSRLEESSSPPSPPHRRWSSSDSNMGFGERAVSVAGAAFFFHDSCESPRCGEDEVTSSGSCWSSILPLRSITMEGKWLPLGPNTILPDIRCFPSCAHGGIFSTEPVCPDSFQYKGTLDVFYKVVRQEGFARLWRGTNSGLALAVPTVGICLPCYDMFCNWIEQFTACNASSLTPCGPLVAGSLARSLACITCSPIELARTRMQIQRRLLALVGEGGNSSSMLGENFSAGFVAGSLAAAATCPLDVAKTRRQIEKDPARALKMTTRQTLVEIWRDGGLKGLLTGVGPRVGRAGPSVGIVVSFYEVVKYVLRQRRMNS